jgi:hypothetical protein
MVELELALLNQRTADLLGVEGVAAGPLQQRGLRVGR